MLPACGMTSVMLVWANVSKRNSLNTAAQEAESHSGDTLIICEVFQTSQDWNI